MAATSNPLDRAGVTVQARDTGDRFTGPSTSGMLQLASSLADLEPTAGRAVQNFANSEAEKYQAQARKDALEANGARLADATRAGIIAPTQNPWYMEAYAREGAAIRAKSSFDQLQVDSASWAEKNDPQAFEKRWREEVGNLAKDYTGKDEIEGFAPVEAQATSQALQSNVATNSNRIVQERTDNLSALAANAVANTARVNGGSLTAAQGLAALEPAKQQWFATGGSAGDWNKIVIQAVTSAAESTQNAGLLDFLRAIPSDPASTDPSLPHDSEFGAGSHLSLAPDAPQVPQIADATNGPLDVPGTVNALWSALTHQESGSRQFGKDGGLIVSPKGAGGVAQLMPATAKEWAGELGKPELANLAFQPTAEGAAANETLGRYGLGKLLQQFGSPEQALAAYNAGPNRRFLKNGLTGQAFVDSIPIPETKNYVSSILAKAALPVGGSSPVSPLEQATPTGYTGVQGQPSLYDQAGVAEQVETTRYRITQNADSQAQDRLRNITAGVKLQANDAVSSLYGQYGSRLLTGGVDQAAIISSLQGKVPPQVIGEVLSQVRGYAGDSQALGSAKMNLYGNSKAGAQDLFDIATEAAQKGWSPEFEERVGKLVGNGSISYSDGMQFVDKATSTSRQLDALAGRTGQTVTNYAQLTKRSDALSADVINTVQQAGKRLVDPRLAKANSRQINTVMMAYLAANPGDWDGAVQVGKQTAARMKLRALLNIKNQLENPVPHRSIFHGPVGGNPRG